MTEQATPTPQQAWDQLYAGNVRFASDTGTHPRADETWRRRLAEAQHPHAVVFGCSDSRPAHELLFDEGLGDLFVVRNAGQVLTPSSLGSIEFAVGPLSVPLLVVLGHQSCDAVRKAIRSTAVEAPELPDSIWRLIAPIVPTAQRVMRASHTDADTVDALEVGRQHVRKTIEELLTSSPMTAAAVSNGRLGIVGGIYMLAEGTVVPHIVRGPIVIPDL